MKLPFDTSFMNILQRKQSCSKLSIATTVLSVEEKVIKYKQKKTQQQRKNNTKSYQGFGYTYKPFQFNLNK